MTKTISTEKLKALRKTTKGFLLIDVLSKERFDQDHIPGARNAPLDGKNFVQDVTLKASGSKTRKVVLYCAGPDCDASSKALKILVARGFTDVVEYEGGLSSWNESKRAVQAQNAKTKV